MQLDGTSARIGLTASDSGSEDPAPTVMYVVSNATIPRARIAGIGTYLPETVVTSPDLEQSMREAGLSVARGFIERMTGIAARHVASRDENASDLAVAAASKALEAAEMTAADVDVLIFAAASHDVTEPATANIVQVKLGARRAAVFDVKNACNSFLSAVDIADAFIRLGRARAILIATGEVPSLVVDRGIRTRSELNERFSHLTMGDAGGAVVVVPTEDPERGIRATAATSDGAAWSLGTVLSYGSMYPHDTSPARAFLHTESCALEARARTDMPSVMRAALAAAGWSPGTVDVIACHQHTRKIAHELAVAIGMRPACVALPLRYAGNAAAANIPLALADARREGALVPGARVLLCGGSAGFSAMASAVTW